MGNEQGTHGPAQRIMVLGEPTVARALAHLMSAHHGQYFRPAVEEEVEFANDYTRVIYLTERGNPALSVLRMTFRLREELTWTGGLIAVVPSGEDKARADETVLADGPSGRVCFGTTPGHVSVAWPGVVAGVLRALAEVSSLPHGAWLRIQDMSRTSILIEQLRSLEEQVTSGGSTEHSKLETLLDTFTAIDWRPLLIDPHRQLAHVDRIRARMTEMLQHPSADAAAILNGVRDCLLHTWLRFRE